MSMTKTRASIFDRDEAVDLSGFQPKAGLTPDALPAEEVRAIAEASNFPSREAKKHPPTASAPSRREPRRHRTGRTVQFNARTTQKCFDGMYAIADRQGWLVGETLEKAYEALRRELDGQGRG